MVVNHLYKSMIHILGLKFEEERLVYLGLADIYGIGKETGIKIINELSIPKKYRMKDLTQSQIQELTLTLRNYKIESDLHRQISDKIGKFKETRSSRILKHGK